LKLYSDFLILKKFFEMNLNFLFTGTNILSYITLA